jgi:hypothetical protein
MDIVDFLVLWLLRIIFRTERIGYIVFQRLFYIKYKLLETMKESCESSLLMESNDFLRTMKGMGWLKCGHVFVNDEQCRESLLRHGYGAVK